MCHTLTVIRLFTLTLIWFEPLRNVRHYCVSLNASEFLAQFNAILSTRRTLTLAGHFRSTFPEKKLKSFGFKFCYPIVKMSISCLDQCNCTIVLVKQSLTKHVSKLKFSERSLS